MRLLPTDGHFYALLREQLIVLCRASESLEAGLNQNDLPERLGEIGSLEKRGDQIVRDTISHLQQTFLTPFEPDQVQTLTRRLDDVLDAIEEASFRIVTYHLSPAGPELAQMAEIVRESCHCLQSGVEAVTHGRPAISDCEAVASLESRADALWREQLSKLFAGSYSATEVFENKEVIEALEQIVDRCDAVANTLEDISRQWCKHRIP